MTLNLWGNLEEDFQPEEQQPEPKQPEPKEQQFSRYLKSLTNLLGSKQDEKPPTSQQK